ncbi:hypothetical protein [Pseudomonas aeruginosa]|uniref:hypothetical protein n=1 Tax=Pseudomonas aeruginosa TaxID=287 RepID=UPI000FC43238|nr:hypothetical protein [Pseudomonas aeruginosa]RUI20253.1 hypothetical protein IPC443_23490 [Pseudomonas aeruginosa]
MIDSRETQEQLLHRVLQGNLDAIRFCETLFEISQTLDDIVDGDKALTPQEVYGAFWLALVELPVNPFYRHFEHFIRPLMAAALQDWRDSVVLERSGDEHGQTLAFVLRDQLTSLVVQCAYLVGGAAWMVQVSEGTSTPELQRRVAQFGRQMGLLPDAGGKPLPSFVQKSEDKDLEALAGSAGINEQLGRIVGQIDSGALELGPLSNRLSEARNYLGSSTDQSRNYASLNSTLETLRNASLRLNAGVQTDGDAKRAWNELITNINDPALVKQRIQEITALNDRAVELKTNMINLRRRNAQAPELDVTSVVPQLGIPKEQSRPQPTPAQQIVRVASDEDYNRLPSGAVFIDPQGNQRRKP